MASKIKVIKTWATIYFTGTYKKETATVELTLNYDESTWDVCTEGQEDVSFKRDNIDIAKARIKAVQAAINYAEKELNQYYKDYYGE